MAYYAAPQPEQSSLGTRPVSFAWFEESWSVFSRQSGQWILGLAIAGGIWVAVYVIGMVLVMLPKISSVIASGGSAPVTSGTVYSDFGFDIRYALLLLGLVILQSLFSGGFLKMAIRAISGEMIQGTDVFSGGMLTIPMSVITLILVVPNMVIGFAITLPGAPMPWTSTWFLREGASMLTEAVVGGTLTVLFAPAFALVAAGASLPHALRKSMQGMVKVLLPALGLYVVYIVLVTLSCLPCLLGTMITVPMGYLLCAIAARDRAGLAVTVASPGFAEPPVVPGIWPPPPTLAGSPRPPVANPSPFEGDVLEKGPESPQSGDDGTHAV